jgi:hypothetical protein
MRYRGNILYIRNFESRRIQRSNRRFSSRPRSLDPDFEILHAKFLCRLACAFGCDLRRERCALSRATKSASSSRGPGDGITLAICDRHNRVIERRVDMGDTVHNVLLNFLACTRLCHDSACHSQSDKEPVQLIDDWRAICEPHDAALFSFVHSCGFSDLATAIRADDVYRGRYPNPSVA